MQHLSSRMGVIRYCRSICCRLDRLSAVETLRLQLEGRLLSRAISHAFNASSNCCFIIMLFSSLAAHLADLLDTAARSGRARVLLSVRPQARFPGQSLIGSTRLV